ncbi:hypothetical protein DJ030_01170 [bacterium endosymbiont of Escarpia laminata]|nr:MAG: hypothetical protein DJ030_01170 [bacterium endosymbiont of Escarpia laminata]
MIFICPVLSGIFRGNYGIYRPLKPKPLGLSLPIAMAYSHAFSYDLPMRIKMKSLGELFGSRESIKTLNKKLAQHAALLARIRQLLPEPLGDHCIGAVPHETRLVLFVDSPAWASRFRYLGRDLQEKLKAEGVALESIRIKVFLPQSAPAQRPHPAEPLTLSKESAAIIRSSAEYTESAELREALLRLSKHGSGQ